MDLFTRTDLAALIEPHCTPRVTIYFATHPGGGDDNRLRWKEQLHRAERQLAALGTAPAVIDAVLRPGSEYPSAGRAEFWRQTGTGLAAFLAPGFTRLYRLSLDFTDQVVVGSQFHVGPLLPWVDADGRFFVLALSQNRARLLEGTAHTVRRVEVAGLPQGVEAARPAQGVCPLRRFLRRRVPASSP